MKVQIGLIGDYSSEVVAHAAIPKALAIAATNLQLEVEATWLPTPSLAGDSSSLSAFNGLWCVPASPYASMEGALAAIRFARKNGRPFLGTCGGFQHAIVEYARNVLGYAEADHAESNPTAIMPLIAPLSCSLVGATGLIKLLAGSRVASIYEMDEVVEQYHCNYGVNPHYHTMLEKGELRITGVDAEGEPRVVELGEHPFFIATLFQPERSALSGNLHPLIRAYLETASRL